MAEATIDSLQLEVSSSSDEASKGLDALTKSLKKLHTATSKGLGLTAVVDELKAADTSIKSSSLDGLTKAVDTLSKLGGVKISASIGNQITAISTALQGANFAGGAEKMQSLVTALEPLGQLGKSNLSSYVTALKKLPDTFAELNKLDMSAVTAKVQELATALKPLGDEMQKVANGFSAFPAKIQKLIAGTNKLSAANNKASFSYINLYARLRMAWGAVKGIASKISNWITLSSDYTETMNLFTVSMGQYAEAAYGYAQRVGEAMGIDPAEWMRHQGVFMTLTKGFGVAGDRANTMSQQLTQLGYDLSSFFNISVEDAMTKLESGIAGELEPLRRLGYDLSQAKLEATALSMGIDKAVSSMTQAEKAELRYYAIMTQVTDAHHDMARTLNAPANQLRILKAQVTQLGRALGNFFIPLLNQVLPYIIASVKVLREVLDVFMDLLGIELAEVDFDKGSIVSATGEVASNLEDGQKEAKKLKSYMLGFDELNVLNTDDGSDLEDLLGSGFNFELPTYDFMDGIVATQVDSIVAKIKEWVGLTEPIKSWADFLDTKLGDVLVKVGAIATALGAWKISKAFLTALKTIKTLTGKKIIWGNLLTGAALFLQDLTTMQEYIEDFAEKGATFETVSGILSTFAGMVGDTMIVLGKTEIGGALKLVEGVGQIVSEVAKMSKEGVNADGLLGICNGLSNIVIGIGALTKNWKLMGVGMTLQGLTTIIDEIAENWEAIKKGDWSGVDVATLAIGAIELIAGLVTALGVFNKVKSGVDTAKAAKSIGEVGNTVTEISTTTSTLTTKLTTLVKNLGLGIAIIAEVAVAAGLIVAAIWGIGELLNQVGDAWQPVLDNAGTVAIAIGVGTGLLVAIGVATAAIGTVGTPLIANLALGTAMLAMLGVNTALFLAEILVVGKLLNEIGQAWQPVLDNGDTIAKGITIGTALLVGIGAVTALLGAAAVASVGLLPLAIALGTAMLVELAVAFSAFCKSLSSVAKDITDTLAPSLAKMNKVLPDASSDMADFTYFMGDFAGKAVKFSVSNAIAGIAATVDKIIDFFTTDPIKRMSDSVKKQYEQSSTLYNDLVKAIPKIKDATAKMKEYNDAMDKFEATAGTGSNKNGIISYIYEFAVNIKDSASAWLSLKTGATSAWQGVQLVFSSVGKFFEDTFEGAWTKVKNVFSTGGKIFDGIKEGIVSAFKTIVNGLIKGINTVIATPFNAINGVIKTIKDVSIAGLKPFKNLPTISVPQIPLLASGGFPEMGQMFIAREAGAELVGNIGGRSAVMNNDQIVESVSAGVYQAVLAALGGNNEDGGETNIVINLDGEKIYENQQKIARGRGYNLGMGAFSFG